MNEEVEQQELKPEEHNFDKEYKEQFFEGQKKKKSIFKRIWDWFKEDDLFKDGKENE